MASVLERPGIDWIAPSLQPRASGRSARNHRSGRDGPRLTHDEPARADDGGQGYSGMNWPSPGP